MKLIREEIEQVDYLVEQDGEKKSHKIKGIFMLISRIEMAVFILWRY